MLRISNRVPLCGKYVSFKMPREKFGAFFTDRKRLSDKNKYLGKNQKKKKCSLATLGIRLFNIIFSIIY